MRRFIKIYRPQDLTSPLASNSSARFKSFDRANQDRSTAWDRAVGGSHGHLINAKDLIIYEDNHLLGTILQHDT